MTEFLKSIYSKGKPSFYTWKFRYSLGVTCIHLLTLVDPFELFDISENDWVWRDYLVDNPVSDQFSQVLDQLITVGLKKRFVNVDQVFESLNYQPVNYQPNPVNQPATLPRPKPSNQIVVSAKYEKLEELLAAGEWKEADQETARVMLQVADREEDGYLDRDSIEKFPCEDLRTIDQLWVKYSNGRFGFSVQKNIWLECGGKVDHETECELGDRLGWRVNGKWISYEEGTFSIEAPCSGHLPVWCGLLGFGLAGLVFGLGRSWLGVLGRGLGLCSLASRAASCGL